MMARAYMTLRIALLGPSFLRALRQHDYAAHNLDKAVREVLGK